MTKGRLTLRKTPRELNGRDRQRDEPGVTPEPQKLSRRQKRARLRSTERAVARRNRKPAGTGRQRLARWAQESHVELARQANRLGIELETDQDRKRLCITLARQQARLAGVSNATWACATRKERAELIERAAK